MARPMAASSWVGRRQAQGARPHQRVRRRSCLRATRCRADPKATISTGGDADRQRRHRHHDRRRDPVDRAGRARGERAPAGEPVAAARPPDAGRALPRARRGCLARAAAAGGRRADADQGPGQGPVRAGRAAPIARLELPRRRLRFHQRAAGQWQGQRPLHRLHPGHQAGADRGAGAARAGHAAARAGAEGIERRQPGRGHRKPCSTANPGRDGAFHGRTPRADRGR